MADPKALAVIRQNFYRRAPPIAEHEEPATKWIDCKLRPADPCQPIDAGPKFDARDCHQDPHLRRELNHGCAVQPDPHSCNTISVAALDAISSCSRSPCGPRSDTRHPPGLAGNTPVTSTNFIGFGSGRRLASPRP